MSICRHTNHGIIFLSPQADGGGQFFRDAWEGTDPATLPAECDDTNAVDGTDYSTCYSGWTVDACGFGYDYTSVMHYRLNS